MIWILLVSGHPWVRAAGAQQSAAAHPDPEQSRALWAPRGLCALPEAAVPFGRRFFANKDACQPAGRCVWKPELQTVFIMGLVSGSLKLKN